MRNPCRLTGIVGVLAAVLVTVSALGQALAGDALRASLRGYSEVPPISTGARGDFRGTISSDDTTIDYEESYEGLEGAVTQSHIHFGPRGVSGGISVWLCQTAAAPAPASVAQITPFCPPSPGTVKGTLTEKNVIGPVGQGITAGDFAELLKAIRAGLSYANIHSREADGVAANFNAGEIRGQITVSRGHDKDDD